MLKNLHISDFAIIDEVDIDLETGMTALTGETGAGKSILLDALGLVLGDRADTAVLREGAQRAEINATFDIRDLADARLWLRENELDLPGEEHGCILRRTIGNDGRSKGYINGSPVTLQHLRALGEMLVDIHGQHEHQSLLRREVQRQRLDDYGDHQALLSELADVYTRWRSVHDNLRALRVAERDRGQRLDLLRFQAREFEQLQLAENEWESLQEEHQRLAHASKLMEGSQRALYALYDDDDALYTVLSQHVRRLEELATIDPALSSIVESLNGALVQIDETSDQLRGYLDRLNLDPGRLEWVESRIGAIHELTRKHRVAPEALHEVAREIRAELDTLEHADERLVALEAECQRLVKSYLDCAKALSNRRQAAAQKLSKAVTDAMQHLGMSGGRFEVEVIARPFDPTAGEGFSSSGLDTIELLVSANPGQAPRPLNKVASGGELSRISLAIQMITANTESIPTLIFDEVDAGIGGGIAEIVGAQLRRLSETGHAKTSAQKQVMCVTHLPQVAAQAHQHLKVDKVPGKGKTVRTDVRKLTERERTDEIARMLGGVEITEKTRLHAEEMIAKAATNAA
ncbi:MAG TPA: DNA repair protein RecN [Gammaproteobacteria bacterium]|jgi:DNA repair protein RecN (Recombination protein N)